MTMPLPSRRLIVSEPGQLDECVRDMAGSRAVGLDTESDGFHRYPEQLCLIQIATAGTVYVVDAVTLGDIAPLKGVLADAAVMKVIHGADYDIRSLYRHGELSVRNLYDTSIAARFTGAVQFGLAAALKDILGVTIPKSKRLQLTDWGRRPIAVEALDYAVSDVRHLLALQNVLSGRIESLGRTAWVAEECQRLEGVRYAEPDPESAFLAIKGAGVLDGRGLAILRSLYLFREQEARRQRRPPFFIMADAALIELAAVPTVDPATVAGVGPAGAARLGRGLRQAMREGMAAPPVHKQPAPPYVRPGRAELERLGHLKAWRTALGASLSLDPSLLWPAASLEKLAAAPDTYDAELASAAVRRWQRDQFASSLLACLKMMPAGPAVGRHIPSGGAKV